MKWAKPKWISAWLDRRRKAAVQRALKRCHTKALRDAAALVNERIKAIRELTAELAALKNDLALERQRAERLGRELELAKLENELLAAIHERDRNRVRAESEIAIGRAEGIAAKLRGIVGDE